MESSYKILGVIPARGGSKDIPRKNINHNAEKYYRNSLRYTEKDSKTPLPNFLVLGEPKCATTWLYKCLKLHSDIYVPERKEIEFFNNHYDQGINWYKSFFSGWKGEKAIGEVSIGYFSQKSVPERIKKHLDSSSFKMIVCLREPVDRAFSYYKFRAMKGGAPDNFKESLEKLYFRKLYIEPGHYVENYKNYLNYFKKENILILLFENIKENPLREIQKVYRFLGVNPGFNHSQFYKKENVGSFPRNPKLYRNLLKFRTRIKLFFGMFGMRTKFYKIIDIFFLRLIKRIILSKNKKLMPVISKETRSKLKKEFLESNEELARLADLDLSSWR